MSNDRSSRRQFVSGVAQMAAMAAVSGVAVSEAEAASASDEWDLSWTAIVKQASDRAVFDWISMGDGSDSTMLMLAERYLDNCATAYGRRKYKPVAVLNIRTGATSAGLSDAAWARYGIGAEQKVNDPVTKQPATRNVYWTLAPGETRQLGRPTLEELIPRGAIFLVCDFAMGHLADRLAKAKGLNKDDVHADLRKSLIPHAYLMPSGIFGLARAQNAGCALIGL